MQDSYGREINYLRLSITDRCNFRCRYCMPEAGIEKCSHEEILSFEEITGLVKAAAGLGVNRVRLTGGEPTTRLELPNLVRMLNGIDGIEEISMTTNGSKLAGTAQELARAGLSRVNISLDAIDADKFGEITRGGNVKDVLAGIRAAKEANLDPVKLNAVVIKGVNESEILPLVDYAVSSGLVLRFIELMPMGEVAEEDLDLTPLEEVRGLIEDRWNLAAASGPEGSGPATYYRVSRGEEKGTIGFIFPISRSFCAGCNRIRVTAKGSVRPCLARDEQYELDFDEDTPIDEIEEQLARIIKEKPHGHKWEEEEATSGEMSEIGG